MRSRDIRAGFQSFWFRRNSRQHSRKRSRPPLIFMYAGYSWQSGHGEERKQMARASVRPPTSHVGPIHTAYWQRHRPMWTQYPGYSGLILNWNFPLGKFHIRIIPPQKTPKLKDFKGTLLQFFSVTSIQVYKGVRGGQSVSVFMSNSALIFTGGD